MDEQRQKLTELRAKLEEAYKELKAGKTEDLKAFADMDALEAGEQQYAALEKEVGQFDRLQALHTARQQSDEAAPEGSALAAAQQGVVGTDSEGEGAKGADAPVVNPEDQDRIAAADQDGTVDPDAPAGEGEGNAAVIAAAAAGGFDPENAGFKEAVNAAVLVAVRDEKVRRDLISQSLEDDYKALTGPQYGPQAYLKELSVLGQIYKEASPVGKGYWKPYTAGAFRALVAHGTDAQLTAGRPEIRMRPESQRTLMNIVPKETLTEGEEVEATLFGETGLNGAVAPVAGGAALPESAYQTVRVSDYMEFIAEYSPFTLRMIVADQRVYRAVLRRSLYNLEKKVESGMASGNSTDPNLKGLLGGGSGTDYGLGTKNHWSIPAYTLEDADTFWQHVVKAHAKVEADSDGSIPNRIVLSPAMMGKIRSDTGKNLALKVGTGVVDDVIERGDGRPNYQQVVELFDGLNPFVRNNQLHTNKDVAIMGDFSECQYYEYGRLYQKMLPGYAVPAMTVSGGGTPETRVKPANVEHLAVGTWGCFLLFNAKSFITINFG